MSALVTVGVVLLALPVLLFGYAYVAYPALLWLMTRPGRAVGAAGVAGGSGQEAPPEWPTISISLPAFNEVDSIAATLEHLLALDYPAERRQIVVVSDASDDGTDDVVRSYADRGVELVRLDERRGKTAAEAAAIPHLTGEIVVNTDATISIPSGSLKPLIRAFADPTVGVASGRDISVGDLETEANRPESGYVGYEMWVRSLETGFGSIVGASGCFYAIRRHLHRPDFPEALSRDFASCIIARESGFRAVSVDEAVCFVPRTASLEKEFRRKVRTMARGLQTLWYKRVLLDPVRYGRFAWMLASHKLSRWLVWLTWPGALLGLVLLTVALPELWPLTAAVLAALAVGWVGWKFSARAALPRPLSLLAYAVSGAAAGFSAWMQALRGRRLAVWEPTRR